VPARHDDEIAAPVNLPFSQHPGEFLSHDFFRFGETFPVGKFRPVVNHRHLEADHGADLGQIKGDVPSAEDQHLGFRDDRFDVNIDDPAADHADIAGFRAGKVIVERPGLFFAESLQG